MAALDDLGAWLEKYAADRVTDAVAPYLDTQADLDRVTAELTAARSELETARAAHAVDLATISELQARVTALQTAAAPDPAILPGWGAPVWRDEFDGDLSKWNVRDGEQLSYDLATILARNVTIRDGQLVITTKREAVKGREWTTGYVDTIGKFEQKYGRFEARMRLNTTAGDSAGIWPAFWLRALKALGEIDVAEAWGEPQSARAAEYRPGAASWSLHEDTNGGKGKRSGWLVPAGAPRLSDDFHVFGVEWTPDHIAVLLDGKPVADGTTTTAATPWLATAFSAPMHLRLQTQVGGYYGPPTAATRAPTELLVDWVRVYAKP